MDIPNSSTNGTQSSFISSESFNIFILDFFVLVISSSLFWVGISSAILIHFIIRYIFRLKNSDSDAKFHDETEDTWGKEYFNGFDYIWEQNHDAFWDNNGKNHDYFLDNNVKFNSNNVKFNSNDLNDRDESAQLDLIKRHKKIEALEEDVKQKLEPSFSFKFEYQMPQNDKEGSSNNPIIREEKLPKLGKFEKEVSNEKTISPRIQNYQIVLEEKLSGLGEPSETMRVFSKESYTKPKFEKLDTKEKNIDHSLDKIVGSIEKLQTETEPETNLESKSEVQSEIELEIESKTEIEQNIESKLEPKLEPEPEAESEPEPEAESESESERLDHEERDIDMKSKRNSSEEFDHESCCENELECTHSVQTLSPKDEITPGNNANFYPINELNESENSQSETETPLMKPKRISTSSPSTISSHDRYKSRRKIVSEEFSSFDSDSDSSLSDGYSVKDLVVDSDIDWFLSERESGKFVNKYYGTNKSSNLEKYTVNIMDDIREFEKNRAKSFSGFERDLNGSKSQFAYIHNQPDKVEVWSLNSLKDEVEERKLDGDDNLEEFEGSRETILGSKGSFDIYVNDYNEAENEFEEQKGDAYFYKEKLDDYNEAENEFEERKLDVDFYKQKLDEGHNSDQELEVSKETNSESKISLDTYVNDHNEVGLNSSNENYVPIKTEFSDSETDIDSSNHDDNIPPLKNLYTEKPIEEPEKTKNDLKNKGKEHLVEEYEEENDDLESLWEHQDLIEQLKMEIKKAKAVGLPTIMEESETPKTTIEDLKPFRFDEKFLREDPMDELHKFYKSYRERMRKFDILNYQKMYAIGFLQLKDPLESMGSQKPILPTITSILSHNLYKGRKSDDPSERFVRELRCDLETVYVGQMCLSWEFLRWQYEKSCEMTESDPFRSHQYNQSAGEFQQFQVLINRFVENEPFQGHRLPNYVKNRCVLRNLLQVPIIKEDSFKEKSEEQRKGNYAVTSEELEDIMEESIRVFWEFVKADKDETLGILKGLMGPQVELQEPSDYAFMMHLHSILQKKEKRLKDNLRTGNCIVKKFKKPKEDRSNEDLFFSHVDIKLVAKVLKMPRITSEQLQWCHKKLEKISFIDRKIQREPSFLLFPC